MINNMCSHFLKITSACLLTLMAVSCTRDGNSANNLPVNNAQPLIEQVTAEGVCIYFRNNWSMTILSDGSGTIAYGFAGGDQIVCPANTFDFASVMKHISETMKPQKPTEVGSKYLNVSLRNPDRSGYIPCETSTAIFRTVFAKYVDYGPPNMLDLLKEYPANCSVVQAK